MEVGYTLLGICIGALAINLVWRHWVVKKLLTQLENALECAKLRPNFPPVRHYEQMKAALNELVNLKDHKDTFGDTLEYRRRKDRAWDDARGALRR